MQHISDMHSKFALRPHHVSKYAEIRRGIKKRRQKIEITGQKYNVCICYAERQYKIITSVQEVRYAVSMYNHHHHTTTILRPFFQDHPGEPVPEENFWTLWCKGILTEADTPTIQLGATGSRLTSAHLHHPPAYVK